MGTVVPVLGLDHVPFPFGYIEVRIQVHLCGSTALPYQVRPSALYIQQYLDQLPGRSTNG